MPINISGSWRPGGTMPIARRGMGNQFEVQGRENPNDPMALMLSQMPNVRQLETRANMADAAELARVAGAEEEESNRFLMGQGPISSVNRTSREMGNQLQQRIHNNPFRLFFQNLKDRGVDELQTAAAAGTKQGGGRDVLQESDDPRFPQRREIGLGGGGRGFFDTQTASTANTTSTSPVSTQKLWLEQLLNARDLNMYGRRR